MNVVVRDAAFDDLERLYAWIAKDRPGVARDVIERIFEAIDRLSVFPAIGHKGSVGDTLEWAVRNLPYIIVYQVDADASAVCVVGIFHASQDR